MKSVKKKHNPLERGLCGMVEVTHTAWRELLHKHGLLPVADILEKYGIASAIDVSELKQDDFIALEDLGLKPFMLMKIKRKRSNKATCGKKECQG